MLKKQIGAIAAGVLSAGLFSQAASAGETRGYVLDWWGMATYSKDIDCPDGMNPKADVMFRRILREMGKTPREIEEIYKDFPYPIYMIATDRGRIDGKPTNVYITPTSWPDPKIKTATGAKETYGFNLDGNDKTGGYTDVDTGAKGVDNNLYRALGCFETQRAMPPERPTYPYIYWDMTRDFTGAWLIEVSGIDNDQNDDDVTVGIYRALNPVTRNAAGNVVQDMSFKVDPNPRSQRVVKAKIKDGRIFTEGFDFYMTGDPLAIIDYELSKAQFRLDLKADGTMTGVVGGYQDWRKIYSGFALPGVTNEINVGVDVPGIYYTLKRLADADPDPKTGENRRISASYSMAGIPAFIDHSANGEKVAAK
ncbi:MAG: hypothetical protein K2P94_06180 [Rhodospirillaceae bacterium]|nr:hypothetical protein [Rhodospirillaceae bacterium]